MLGISAIDTALWDCLGRSLGVPCSQLWGRVNDRIPAYAMVGWLNYDDAEVQRICAQAVEQGFRAVKIKVGYPTLAEDVKRLRADAELRARLGAAARTHAEARFDAPAVVARLEQLYLDVTRQRE